MEIDVEDIEEGTNGFWKTILTQNGHYSVEDDEEHEGYVKPKLIENWTEGQDFDFEVNVTAPPIKLQEKDCIVTNNTIMENVEPDQNFDGLSNVNVYNQVVVPSLETLNNKRIYSEGLVTVENLMTNSSTNQGITKESTLNFDLYVPEVRFNTITNNNVDYTLSQLTQDQSDYFSKNSIIKCNISEILPTYNLSNFKIRFNKTAFIISRQDNKLKADSSMTLITPSWKRVTNLNNPVSVYGGSNLVLINKMGTNLWSLEIVDYGNNLNYLIPEGVTESYYFNYTFSGIGTSQNFLTYETDTNIETLLKYSCLWNSGQGDYLLFTTIKKFILNVDQSF